MLDLSKYRELQHLTQEELAEKSGLSVRTIQRIEAGTAPKGYTLKALARALGIDATQLTQKTNDRQDHGKGADLQADSGSGLIKLVNLSSLPFMFLPPLNIVVPLLIVLYRKNEKDLAAKQLLSIQILWTVIAVLLFMLGTFIRKWFNLGNGINTAIICGSILCNALIILKNGAALGRSGRLYFKLNFSLL